MSELGYQDVVKQRVVVRRRTPWGKYNAHEKISSSSSIGKLGKELVKQGVMNMNEVWK